MDDPMGVAFITASTLCCTSLVATAVFGAAVLWIVPPRFRLLHRLLASMRLSRSGVIATATVLHVWDTGVVTSYKLLYGMRLKVEPPDGPSFEVELDETVPFNQKLMFQPGALLQVKYDPAYRKNIAILTALGAMSAPSVEQMLLRVQSKNEKLTAAGMEATAKVLQCQSMRLGAGGDRSVVTLQVEVEPASGPKFSAQIQEVIMESTDRKYQPGQLIAIKYDPDDLSQVALVRSGV